MAKRQWTRGRGTREDSFNGWLGEALRQTSARWRRDPDTVQIERQGRDRLDIVVDDRHMQPVVIETSYGGDRDADARKYLDRYANIDTGIAVVVPPAFKAMQETEAREALSLGRPPLEYAVLQRDGHRFPSSGYIKGTVRDLAAIIPAAAVTRERLADLADVVVEHIDRARSILEARIPRATADEIADVVHQRSHMTGYRTLLVLWLDAMLVQAHLHSAQTPAAEALPLAREVSAAKLVAAWEDILATNWRSIFKPAIDCLDKVRRANRHAATAALRELIRAVDAIEEARLGDHINIAAELFPKLSEDRKSAAAFYTTPATAETVAAVC